MSQLLMLHPDVAQFSESRPSTASELDRTDAAELAELLNEAFDEHGWTEQTAIAKLIDAPDILAVIGIKENGKLIATASARRDLTNFPDQGYVHMVGTSLSARGRGLGRIATEAVLLRFAAEGLREAVLETDDWRLPALRTYLGMGFVPTFRDDTQPARWSAIFQKLCSSRPPVTDPLDRT